ncbi:hydroxymethylglutaryl-CoA reductase, degradative [Fructobacillus sp. M2-14]|uniref:3-hydroxy-3-methylglutaryl coenzyme A reductase n=1 Tax=Fructobacillus broussonetiae TaxID=2713173 RepID=A0ABS5R385_9LACO|nr:hydroxymethylglutaryl-CoA reductase, degradative [Fructobacillus broussonetiae]MBS9338622.1 hydroxymethylglutaryl-CoA reductase, degradative [Fructobacillus broussonetiae]
MNKKFYQLTAEERLEALGLDESIKAFYACNQSKDSEQLIENYVTDYRLPEGILRNLQVDGQVYQVPMVTEEPSVIAAANNGASITNLGSAFITTQVGEPVLGGQILFDHVDYEELNRFVVDHVDDIFQAAKEAKPSMVSRGDGLEAVQLEDLTDHRAVLNLTVKTGKAMGANAMNTILEAVKMLFSSYEKNIVGAILTNAGHDAVVSVETKLPVAAVGGLEAAKKISALSTFGQVSPDRAVTENKGIFNGLAAVVLATGNDYRAVEAAGHAYASRDGKYRSLSKWMVDETAETLVGKIEMPLNIGVLGGAIAALPTAKKNLELLGNPTVEELKSVMLATGLANNLAALKAVSGRGIQAGHMKMQARTLAVQAGASGADIQTVANRLIKSPRIDQKTAEDILGAIENDTQN